MDEQNKSTEELLKEILETLKRMEDKGAEPIWVAPAIPFYTPMPQPVYVPVPYPVPVVPQYPLTVPQPYPHYPPAPIIWCDNTTAGNSAGYIS